MAKAYYADMTRYTLNGSNFHQESGPHATPAEARAGGRKVLEDQGLDPEDFTFEVGLFDIPAEL